MRLDIRGIGNIKDGDEVIGRRTRVKVVKNKVAPPFKEAEFDIMFRGEDVGISREGDLLDLGVDNRIVEKSGTWFSYGGERLGQGRENARVYLRENPDIAMRIENEVREVLAIPWKAPAGAASDAQIPGSTSPETAADTEADKSPAQTAPEEDSTAPGSASTPVETSGQEGSGGQKALPRSQGRKRGKTAA